MLKGLNWLRALTIVGLLLAPAAPALAGGPPPDSPRAYPALLQMAREHPEQTVHVIVQRAGNARLPAQILERMGGRRARELPLVNAVALDLPASAVEALARDPAVRWVSIDAPLRSVGHFGDYTYRDDFPAVAYTGSTGSEEWKTNKWSEIGETDGAGRGLIRVGSAGCSGSYCLTIGNSLLTFFANRGVWRQLDLNKVTSATLSFTYRRSVSSQSAAYVQVQASADAGGTWATLATYWLNTSDAAAQTAQFDLTGYASSTTRVRFLISGSAAGYFYLDNVQVEYTRLNNNYIKTVGAQKLWRSLADEPGQGVTVAVVDSGIASHADFADSSGGYRLVGAVNFSSTSADANDEFGHGTHVAGIIAGLGQASQGARLGVAPLVNLINVKVSGADGSGLVSDLLNGLQWIYDNRLAYNIKVVNISVNSTLPESYLTNPLSAAVELLWFNGITVVVSAGNNGTGAGPVTLCPPANDPFVITVGAADDAGTLDLNDDSVPAFSAYGLTEDGFAKPDLVAPGRNLISTLASPNARIYVDHPANRVDSSYFRMSGTSVAAPVVTGAVALLLQAEPNLTPDQVKYRLMASANVNWAGYSAAKAGAGYLDVFAAVTGDTTASANTGVAISSLLHTGSDPVAWDSVSWNSVSWNSVSWNSVSWNSVSWNSVTWNSSIWDN